MKNRRHLVDITAIILVLIIVIATIYIFINNDNERRDQENRGERITENILLIREDFYTLLTRDKQISETIWDFQRDIFRYLENNIHNPNFNQQELYQKHQFYGNKLDTILLSHQFAIQDIHRKINHILHLIYDEDECDCDKE